jgi:autotransporter-associated beta strand protein
VFFDNSTAGNGTFINNGSTTSNLVNSGSTGFSGSSTAGNATITNNGAAASNTYGGITGFGQTSSAGNATFNNNAGMVAGAHGGFTFLSNDATAANGLFINDGATVSGADGGFTDLGQTSTASNATFVNNGGTVSGAAGGSTIFYDSSTAASATLVANGGSNGGGGGRISFKDNSAGGTSRVEVFGNGNLDISAHDAPGVTIGSVEGDGNVFLGANNLTIGSNDLSTNFSGVIQDGGENGGTGGSLTKICSGMLMLTGANTYTGDTNVNGGVLKVDGSITSNTFVRHGSTLAGTGTINANLTNLRGTVSPGGPSVPGALAVVHDYTQAQYADLMIQIAGTSAGEFSVLNVLGNANLNGYLDPFLLNGFVPAIGDSFIFLNYGSLTGEFSHIKHRVFDNGMLQWSVIYEADHAILTVEQHVPDQGSTLLLLTLGLIGLVTYRRQLARGHH